MVKTSTALTVPVSLLIAIMSMGGVGVGAAPATAPSESPVAVTVVTHHVHQHDHHRHPQTTIVTPGTTTLVQAAPAAPAQGNFLSPILRGIPIAGPITDSLLTSILGGIGIGGGGLGLGLGGLDGLAGGLLKYHPQSASSANATATASGGGLGGLNTIISGTLNAMRGQLGGLGLGLKNSEDIGEIAEKN